MKGLIYFLIVVIVIVGGISAFWWVADDATIEDQIDYIKSKVSDGYEGSVAADTAESASKLGKTLKVQFDEAQGVYQGVPEE